MINPIFASDKIKNEFTGYVSTKFNIADSNFRQLFKDELNRNGAISKGPYLEINEAFKKGHSIDSLVKEGVLSELFLSLEGNKDDSEKEIKINRNLYLHQEEACRKINENKNIIVTTGTGSGKTECFLIPIINSLLKEKEQETLGKGVRAIIIYPMNALANDQMKRLRVIFNNFPDITFGVFNSSTKETKEQGISEYQKLFKGPDGRGLNPIPNEILSREDMRKTPPNILITNYAMLEYMMLRPNDDKVFSESDLKFIVLDESHIYRGATGIETSVLLRRLKARITDSDNIIHILTSATLGGKDSDQEIVKFGSNLCSAEFSPENIIRSQPEIIEVPDNIVGIDDSIFSEISEVTDSLKNIFEKYKFPYYEKKSEEENLFNLCLNSELFSQIRNYTVNPLTLSKLIDKISKERKLNEKILIDYINVSSKAIKNGIPLIKARYHTFLRALEGVFVTIGKDKNLFLNRKTIHYENGKEYAVFEACICDECGRIGIIGKRTEDKLVFSDTRKNSNKESERLIPGSDTEGVYQLNLESGINDEENDIDDEDDRNSKNIEENSFLLCTECGEIHHASASKKFNCGHNPDNIIKVFKSQLTKEKQNHKCSHCGKGNYSKFYLSYDVATSVIGTSLFEQIPESEKVIMANSSLSIDNKMNIFTKRRGVNPKIITKKFQRQFLAFSDSRSDAAYYACSLQDSYQDFLRRRGFWKVMKEQFESQPERKIFEVSEIMTELESKFSNARSFEETGDNEFTNLSNKSKKQSNIAILKEMVGSRKSTSLSAMGMVKFVYKGITDDIADEVRVNYHRYFSEAKDFLNSLVMDIVINGAVTGLPLTDDEKQDIFFTVAQKTFKEMKSGDDRSNISGFCPSRTPSGKIRKSPRITKTMNFLGVSFEDAYMFLSYFWSYLTDPQINPYSMKEYHSGEYVLTTDVFGIIPGLGEKLFICDTCGKTTMYNTGKKCFAFRCSGNLSEISHEDFYTDNHYSRLYSSDLLKPLIIKEHTAQLGRNEQQKYQEQFINKKINALSCSTTFEMGVDVGDLETVFLRNFPPSPANYVQRAGRAGRSLKTAAFVLTYAKLSSHDFTYFNEPETMIKGKVVAPLFSVNNEKIIIRHIFAVALSEFFRINPEIYNGNNADELLNRGGYEKLKEYLDSKPDDLKKILGKSIRKEMHDSMGITDYSWKEKLTGNDGVLEVAVKEYKETIRFYEKEFDRYFNKEKNVLEAGKIERKLKNFRRGKNDDSRSNELISFLTRNNVLPKYGFPVDTVELLENAAYKEENQKLQMIRDLQLAISEYAPESQVVADGNLYTSRYIKKSPAKGSDWEETYIAKCPVASCQTWNQTKNLPEEGLPCISCGETIKKKEWKNSIEPRKGFIAEIGHQKANKKPDKIYRSDDYYIGDTQRRNIGTIELFTESQGNYVELEGTQNDSLMVVCNEEFFVCPRCGYSISVSEKESKTKDSEKNKYRKSTDEITHDSPWGTKCTSKLYRKSLSHTFKTDVLRIKFDSDESFDNNIMRSVMYALLEAISRVLDIERTDIKGCLYKVIHNRKMINTIVLYDAVAGGAGHVKRLLEGNYSNFSKVIEKALEITEGCNCEPSCYSCLRNYYNQFYHDDLNRFAASDFLRDFAGKLIIKEKEEKSDTGKTTETEEFIVDWDRAPNCREAFTSWNELYVLVDPKYRNVLKKLANILPMPDSYGILCKNEKSGIEYDALFGWKENKILFFQNEDLTDIQSEYKLIVISTINEENPEEQIKKWLE